MADDLWNPPPNPEYEARQEARRRQLEVTRDKERRGEETMEQWAWLIFAVLLIMAIIGGSLGWYFFM